MPNTGYKQYANLEQYNLNDGTPTGTTKVNASSDPDYIAPVYDSATCVPASRYYNTVRTATATRNNCGSGFNGTTVTMTAQAGQFLSSVSVADANASADNFLTNNKQNYANAEGVCVQNTLSPLYITVTFTANPTTLYYTLNASGSGNVTSNVAITVRVYGDVSNYTQFLTITVASGTNSTNVNGYLSPNFSSSDNLSYTLSSFTPASDATYEYYVSTQ